MAYFDTPTNPYYTVPWEGTEGLRIRTDAIEWAQQQIADGVRNHQDTYVNQMGSPYGPVLPPVIEQMKPYFPGLEQWYWDNLNQAGDPTMAFPAGQPIAPPASIFNEQGVQSYVQNVLAPANPERFGTRYLPGVGIAEQIANPDQQGILDSVSDRLGTALSLSGLAPLTGLATGVDFLTMLQGGGALGGGMVALEEAASLAGGSGGAISPIAPTLGGISGLDPSWGVNQAPGAAEEAAALGGGLGDMAPIAPTPTIPGLPTTPPMPPANPELPANNATPGNVTGAGVGTNPVTAGAAGTSGALGTVAGLGSAASSVLGRILDGTATAGDWASILGTVGSTALGVYGSNQQADALRDIAEQSRTDRLPFLNQATNWFQNPESYYSGAPAQAAMNATLRGLSVNGNPFGSGTSLSLANEAGLRNWQNAWTGAANIGLGGEDSRNSLNASAVNADAGALNSIGYGLNQITQPQNDLASILRRYGLGGSNAFGLP